MMESRLSAADFTVFSHCRGSSASGVSRISSVMPRIAFIGVRISWLTLAKKASLARLPASASSLARSKSSSSCLRSVMSTLVPIKRMARP